MLTQKINLRIYLHIYTEFDCISLGATVASADFAIAMIGRREYLTRSRHEPQETKDCASSPF
jgi:hypothetical protein